MLTYPEAGARDARALAAALGAWLLLAPLPPALLALLLSAEPAPWGSTTLGCNLKGCQWRDLSY